MWSPSYKTHIGSWNKNKLELVTFLLNLGLVFSFDTALNVFNLGSLGLRRLVAFLIFAWKLFNGLAVSSELLSQLCFKLHNRNLRFYELFYVPTCRTNLSLICLLILAGLVRQKRLAIWPFPVDSQGYKQGRGETIGL